MRLDHGPPRAARNPAKGERDDHGVVELAGDRDEIGHEVERKREVCDGCGEHPLVAAWQPLVGEQATKEHDAVGMNPATARAACWRPATTSAITNAAYAPRATTAVVTTGLIPTTVT